MPMVNEKETSRVEAFSDGVFAIAITLLIIEIKVPHLENSIANQNLILELFRLWPSYLAFAMSFIAILIMWINHHAFFKYLKKIDSPFLFANGFMLMMVTFIPFPTAVLAQYIDTPAAKGAAAFYCGTMVGISAAYNLLWFTTAYRRRLVREEISDEVIIKIRNAYWIGFGLYLIAFFLTFWNPFAGLLLCILLWLYWSILDYSKSKARKTR